MDLLLIFFSSDFTPYSSSCDSDDDNFPFVDYDEYDAQVFKLPAPNFALARYVLVFW